MEQTGRHSPHHGYFVAGRSNSADEAAVADFVDGDLPAEGTVCTEDVPPFGI